MNDIFDNEVIVYSPSIHKDYRGDLWTTYQRGSFKPELDFKHDKYSTSSKGVLRGLHGDFETYKLVSCLSGSMYFVVVDNREDSITYLCWDCMILDDKERKQVLLPPGFANGFYVLEGPALFSYKLNYPESYVDADKQFTLKWNDPALKIDWPDSNPILSERDKSCENIITKARA